MRALLFLLLFCVIATPAQEAKKQIVLTGQLACGKCWFEEDRKISPYGDEHDLECAVDCKVEGEASVLAVNWDKEATLYQLEFGQFKKTDKGWLDYTAKIVEVTGTVREAKGKRFIKVDTIKVVGDNPALAQAGNLVGRAAPELSLKDIAGASQSLSGYRGKIVVLNFWATWCAPCKGEMPAFVKIQNSYAAFGVQVIGASADEADKRAAVIQFVRENQINFPIWMGATNANLAAFGLSASLPATVIIDREGKTVAVFQGVVTAEQLQKQIDALLAEPVKASREVKREAEVATKSSSVPS